MTAAAVPAVPARPPRARRVPLALPARLLRLELRRSPMPWMLPLVIALFWLDGYRYATGFPPFWGLRSPVLPDRAMVDFALFGAGVAAWVGSRDSRRGTRELMMATTMPRWARQLITWAATTGWAMAGYLGCVAVLYWVTAHQGAWGGPPLWPTAVGAAGVAASCALGFAAGAFFPGRFTAPLATLVVFVLATVDKNGGSNSTFTVLSPVNPQGGFRPDSGIFYHYLPDLSIDQVLFLAGLTVAALGALGALGAPAASGGRWLRRSAAAVTAAGLLAAGTAVVLAGTARPAAPGVVIPALYDAASDRPIPYTPVCRGASVPVCLHPAYRAYLPSVTAALGPVLRQVAGLPGAPVRVAQVAYLNPSEFATGGEATIGGHPRVLRLPLGFDVLAQQPLIGFLRSRVAPAIVASVVGGTAGATPAQQAAEAALLQAAGVPVADFAAVKGAHQAPVPGSPVYTAALRFAALPTAARHAWLADHLAALRSGQITLTQLP
jgi:hypothetical protein